jgi:Family of unknown function (DUF6252)
MRGLVIITSLLGFCILSSCQKEFLNPEDEPLDTTVIFKAKINGVQFLATISGAAIRSDSVISIAAESDDRQMIVFTVKDSGVHVYNLDMNNFTNFGGYRDACSIAYASNEGINAGDSGGNLAIVSIDTIKRLISGTFNFKAFNQDIGVQKAITEGIFNNISY